MDPLTLTLSLAYMPSFNHLIWPIIGSIYELALKCAHSYVFWPKNGQPYCRYVCRKAIFYPVQLVLVPCLWRVIPAFMSSCTYQLIFISCRQLSNKRRILRTILRRSMVVESTPKPFPTENGTMHKEGIIEFLRPLKLVRIVFQGQKEVLRR